MAQFNGTLPPVLPVAPAKPKWARNATMKGEIAPDESPSRQIVERRYTTWQNKLKGF
jgi:hypothetical protein